MMRGLALLGAALGLLAVSGCTPAEKAEVREQVAGAREQISEASENARRAAADTALEGKVKAALGTRKGLNGDHINVEAKNGAVMLKGDVESAEQAELAERVALETEGVQSVDNQLMRRVPAKEGSTSTTMPGSTTPVPGTAPAAPGTAPAAPGTAPAAPGTTGEPSGPAPH